MLQKQDLHDPELFFTIKEDTLIDALAVKPEGKKMRVHEKVKEIRAKFKEEGFIVYLDKGLLENQDESSGPGLGLIRSSTLAPSKKLTNQGKRSNSPDDF